MPIRRANGGAVAAARVDEARADDEIGVAGSDRGEELLELGGVVLPVAVEPHGDLVAPRRART